MKINFDLSLIKNKDKNTQSALSEIKIGGSFLKTQNINSMNVQETKMNINHLEIKNQFYDLKKEETSEKKNFFEKKPLFSKEKYSDIFSTTTTQQHKSENRQEHNTPQNDNFVFRFNYNL